MLSDSVFSAAFSDLKKIRNVEGFQSGFLQKSSASSFMEEDLKKSGIAPAHIYAYVPPIGNSSYIIPYYGLDGQPILSLDGYSGMYRQRMNLPEFSKEPRYSQPSGDQLIKNGLPPHMPYLHPLVWKLDGEVIYCCEGEKKTVSLIRHLGKPAFGIGGCQMWRNPDKSGAIHPWIRQLLVSRSIKKVVIVPDGDLLRYDICSAYGTFAQNLKQLGYEVEVVNSPGKIDDLFVKWKESSKAEFDALARIDADDLVQSQSYLATTYHLGSRQTAQGTVEVHQNSSNITILLEAHPSFEKLWVNLDNGSTYIGEQEMLAQQTDMEITNYFQHSLGFHKLSQQLVFSCIDAVARKNAKSPFLEWIKAQTWDGKKRLDDWLIRLWGAKDTVFNRELGMKFLVGSCARQHRPGTKVDWIMCVVGAQGTGKSSMPGVLFKGNDVMIYGETNDKDFHMKLHRGLVAGFDEMDSFGKKEMSFLKAMITSHEDTFRSPYGRKTETFKRRFMLYGSGNKQEFLQEDPTGNRRYPVVTINKKLDFEGLQAELVQLWAEAWQRYQTGNVDVSQIQGTCEVAEEYIIGSILQEKIEDGIARNLKNAGQKFRLGEVFVWIGMDDKSLNGNLARDVSSILRRLGYDCKLVRKEGRPQRLWSSSPLE